MVAPDAFVTGMYWLLERSVGRGMNGITFGQQSFTDLDYEHDVSVLAEQLELLVPVLEVFLGRSYPSGIGSELAKDDGSSLRLCER